VRPFGLEISIEQARGSEEARFDWRGRLRQHPVVHQVAQWTGRSSRGRGRRYNHHYSGNGYQYEADEVRACVERGAIESTTMPLDDSIAVVGTSDMIRSAIRNHSSAGR
jgi:hypothetical protein